MEEVLAQFALKSEDFDLDGQNVVRPLDVMTDPGSASIRDATIDSEQIFDDEPVTEDEERAVAAELGLTMEQVREGRKL